MALASNALTTVAKLTAYMGRALPVRSQFAVFHDASSSATAATVQVTSTTVVLVITGGGNDGTSTLTFASNATVTAMVAAIDALAIGFDARIVGSAGSSTTELQVSAATSCYTQANEQHLDGLDDDAYERVIDATSAWLESFCGRTFASATYRQAYSGTGHEHVRLIQRPVTEIIRTSIGRTDGLQVKCTVSDAFDATVRYDGTSIDLDIIGGANKGTNAVTTASQTIVQVATTITALTGWTASAATTAIGTMDAVDLMKQPSEMCLGVEVPLSIPRENESGVTVESEPGLLKRRYGDFSQPFRGMGGRQPSITPGRLSQFPVWPVGQFNIIVKYVAGYSTTPLDLQMFVNEMSASMLRQGMRDSGLTNETMQGYAYTAAGSLWGNEGFDKKIRPWRSEVGAFPEYEDV